MWIVNDVNDIIRCIDGERESGKAREKEKERGRERNREKGGITHEHVIYSMNEKTNIRKP